jgi:hypothetical protein
VGDVVVTQSRKKVVAEAECDADGDGRRINAGGDNIVRCQS